MHPIIFFIPSNSLSFIIYTFFIYNNILIIIIIIT